LASFSFQVEEKKRKKQRKKNHRKERKHRDGRELSFKLPLCPFTFGSRFCPLTSTLLFQMFSPGIFFFLSRRKEKKTKKKNHRKKKKMERREGAYL
jgi:hypothetical protein